MKFKHQIHILDDQLRDVVFAERWFSNSFTPAAYRWFRQVSQDSSETGKVRRVKDTSVAGFHYATPYGNVFELH